MTLQQYKQQVSEIHDASKNFNGTPEGAVKLFEDLAKKYPEVNEFNAKAMETKDLDEFKSLADSFGMHFSSDESAEKLFTMLHEGKKQLEALALRYKDGAELSDDDLVAVVGGELVQGVLGMAWGFIKLTGLSLAMLCDDMVGNDSGADDIGDQVDSTLNDMIGAWTWHGK